MTSSAASHSAARPDTNKRVHAGPVIGAILAGGVLLGLTVISLAFAGLLALVVMGGLAWQFGRQVIRPSNASPRASVTRFDAYRAARKAQLARDEAAFDAQFARDRAKRDAARFAEFRRGSI